MNREEQIRKAFENHTVKHQEIAHNMHVYQWQNKNGSGDLYMQFLVDHKRLIVTGDLGSHIFKFEVDGKLNIHWLANLDLDYLLEKREAVAVGEDTWNMDVCEQKALQYIQEHLDDDQDYYSYISLEDDKTLFEEYQEDIEFTDAYLNRCTWSKWLDTYGEKYFGDNCWEFVLDWGETTTFGQEAILVALKMISERLEASISEHLIDNIDSTDTNTDL